MISCDAVIFKAVILNVNMFITTLWCTVPSRNVACYCPIVLTQFLCIRVNKYIRAGV